MKITGKKTEVIDFEVTEQAILSSLTDMVQKKLKISSGTYYIRNDTELWQDDPNWYHGSIDEVFVKTLNKKELDLFNSLVLLKEHFL